MTVIRNVINTPHNWATAMGEIECYYIRKIGKHDHVGGSWEAIWDEEGVPVFPSSPEQLKVKSDDADDSHPSGDGARTIRVWGLDSNWAIAYEDVNLNGTTAVTTSNSYLRI